MAPQVPLLTPMLQDLRFAWRTLSRSPLFTLVAVLSLALGIGANSAIFSLVDQVFLRKLPVAEPDRLVLVKDPGPYGNGGAFSDGDDHGPFSYPVYQEIRNAQGFSGLAARWNIAVNLAVGNAAAQLVDGEIVSGNYFEVLGLQPALGRLLTPNDDRQPGAHPVAVLSHQHWQLRFGGRADVVNSTVRINAQPFTIIGVAPQGFTGTQTGRFPGVFAPMMMKAQLTPGNDELKDRTFRWLQIVGRLAPGVSAERATAGLRAALQPAIEQTLAEQTELPADERARALNRQAYLTPGGQGRETLRNDNGEALLILLAMTGLVLLVACANVANLLIARGAARSREIAIRLSVGASRWALIRQMLVESALLSLLAGGAGLLVASWSLAGLQRLVPADTRDFLGASLDARTLAITLLLSLATGLLFGLLPAFQSTRTDLARAMKDQGNSSTMTPSGVRFRRLLVAAQFGLSLVLLIAGGLLARGLTKIGSVHPGFEVERLVSFRMDALLSGYEPKSAPAAYEQLRDRLAAIPGVRDAGIARMPVLADRTWSSTIEAEGCLKANKKNELSVSLNSVDHGFQRLMGIPLRDGRMFDQRDRAKDAATVMVNESFARACWGTASAVGRTIGLGRKRTPTTIVGVLGDARLNVIRDRPVPFVYLPLGQGPGLTDVTFYLRTALPEAAVLGAAERVVRGFDSNLAMLEPRTMREQINETVANERLSAFLATVFALLAVTLAAVGLYGVLAFMVTSRTREIGVRLALGAGSGSVQWLVLKEVLALAGLGLLLGLPAAMLLARVMESLLFGVTPYDPYVFTGATLVLLAAAFLAGYWPARRASRVDPMTALRYD